MNTDMTMEKHHELPRDTEPFERTLARNLENEVRAWRDGRSLRHGMTATGVPVLRRSVRRGAPARREAWS